jgi:hypothetical protein
VRARIGLVEAAEARDADCADIRRDLAASYDRGVKASGHARRHMRTCEGCREFRTGLRGIRRSFAAINPLGAGPLAMAGAKLLGFGGAGGGAAAGGSAAAGGGAAVAGGAAACKVAAVVCTAALATGGAVEVRHLTRDHREAPARGAVKAAPVAAPATDRPAAMPLTGYAPKAVLGPPPRADRAATKKRRAAKQKPTEAAITAPPATTTPEPAAVAEPNVSGGSQAPPAVGEEPAAASPPPTAGAPAAPSGGAEPAPAPAEPAPAPGDPGTGTPPTEH